MKVNGQLEVAQLENLAADPTPAVRGRSYFNTVSLAPKIYNGTTWKTIAYTSSAGSIYNAGNSGKSISINWDNGPVQRLTLSDNCLISFSGTPADATEYTLIVENSSASIYGALFNVYHESLTKRQQPLWLDYGEVVVFKMLYRTTAGTAITTMASAGAGPFSTITGGSGTGRGLDIYKAHRKADSYFLVLSTNQTTNNYQSWPIDKHYGQVSYGDRIQAAPNGAASTDLRVSPSGKVAAYTVTSAVYVYAFPLFAGAQAPATAFSNAATAPTGAAQALMWHPTEKALAVAHTTTPFVTAYPMTTAAFGTKYSNPATLPAGNGKCVAFSPFGDYVAVYHDTTPFVSVYPFDLSTGFGTKVADASALPPGNVSTGGPRQTAWRPQGDWLLCGSATSPYLWQAPFNRSTGTFGTPITVSGSNLPTAEVLAIAFHPSGQFVAVGYVGGLYVYPFNSTTGITNGSALTISSAPSNNTTNLCWSEDGKTLFSLNSGSATILAWSFPYMAVNWYRINDY